ncbi:MAG TPA: hypothetical protein VMV49_18315 [Candidatus Deferrimicrobium sp.]|nr:hypothetical protein [Candidatus Deferrimicrobium sp.]
MAVDKSGNIYCSGITITFGVETNDFALVKFFPNGTKAWNVTWGSSGDEACYGLRLDATGHIYCIGYTDTFGAGNNDLALVKFFPNGTKDWNVTWGGSDYDTGQDLAIASNGNVYCLAGTESFGAGDSDFALVKFYPNGTKAWNTTWGAHANENARKIAINSNDAIYCFGDSASFADPSKDLVLVKFFPNGTLDWNITWGTPNTENAQGLAINPCDEIYLTYDIEGSSMPLIVEKFDANGIKEWNTSWDGSGDEFGIDIAVDSNGNIYCLADYFTDQYDFLVVKFSDPLDCLPPSGIPGFEAIAVLLSLFFLIHIYTVRKHRRLPKII